MSIQNTSKKDITIIGAAIIDILAGPIDKQILKTGSQPVEMMKFSFGGDALNEAIVLKRLGKNVELVSKLGQDEIGSLIIEHIKENGLSIDSIYREKDIKSGMNIVLIDEFGERYFLTNPNGSLRKLAENDIEPYLDTAANIVSFASMFVSPLLDIPAMERIFKRIKSKPGRILIADMTKAKYKEKLKDLECLLPYIDYILPNEEEIALLTGESNSYLNAELLVNAGVSCAIIKCGKNGCLIRNKNEFFNIPAYPIKNVIDTTGAGDNFAAGFIWALSEGFSLPDCGRFACATASCSVEHIGATDGILSIDEPMYRYHKLMDM